MLFRSIVASFGLQMSPLDMGAGVSNCVAEDITNSPVTSPPSVISTQEPFNMTSSMFRMMGGFLFCLGVFGAGIHIYRKYTGVAISSAKRRVKIIERLPLTQKTSLLLVSLDGKELLISSGPDQTRLIQGPSTPTRETFEESFADLYSMPSEEKRCVG